MTNEKRCITPDAYCTIVFMNKIERIMKLQDKYPYDSSIVGLDGKFHSVGTDSFYINSECIQTPKKIINKAKQYLLASTSPQGADTIVHQVKLLDAYYSKGYVYLFVMDLQTDRVYIVDICMECPEDKCTWLLYDLKDYDKLKDYQAVKSYCEKGDENKQKTTANKNSRKLKDDLLEFEF